MCLPYRVVRAAGTVAISHTLSQNGLTLQSSNFIIILTIKITEIILLYIVNSERADQAYTASDKNFWTKMQNCPLRAFIYCPNQMYIKHT